MLVTASADQPSLPREDAWLDSVYAAFDPCVRYDPTLEMVVVRKTRPGFDGGEVARFRKAIADVLKGSHEHVKFVIFDLCAAPGAVSDDAGFQKLLNEASDLILEAPIVSIAWCRGRVERGDLELALASSMIVSEEDAHFSFDFGVLDCLRSYARLAHKVGFVHAERLLDSEALLSPLEMSALHLGKAVLPSRVGDGEIERFVESRRRRHNSAYGIFRAQRMAMPRGR